MNWLNTNLVHNALNVVIWLSSSIAAFLLMTGCTSLVSGGFDCSASWLPPQYALYISAAAGFLKTAINVWRDGFSGLVKPQPPVDKTPSP